MLSRYFCTWQRITRSAAASFGHYIISLRVAVTTVVTEIEAEAPMDLILVRGG